MSNRFTTKNQDFINFFSSVPIFTLLAAASAMVIFQLMGAPTRIPVFDFILIVLAAFRLAELFVYDKVMQFFRDLFVKIESLDISDTEVTVTRKPYPRGIRRTVYDLLSCPWCTSVWSALAIVFFYFLTPYAWYFILVLAVSGISTFIQILSNFIGWSSEHEQIIVGKEEKK